MGAKTGIQWTDATWSPLRVRVREDAAQIAAAKGYTSLIQIGTAMAGRVGQHCEHVSPGCLNCYSGTWQGRCLKSGGTGLPFDRRSRDLVEPFVDEKTLIQPLKWKTPLKIFVENQSDLFGEWYTDEMIDDVFDVFGFSQHHTYQILTKRSERMLAYIQRRYSDRSKHVIRPALVEAWRRVYGLRIGTALGYHHRERQDGRAYAMENVWLGVSVEDQSTADSRIPLLLQTPAAKRFVSYEPALAAVDFTRLPHWGPLEGNTCTRNCLSGVIRDANALEIGFGGPTLDWVIVGGESGPGARPFDVACARNAIAQCKPAGVACLVKQMGSRVVDRNDAGFDGDPGEWPMGTPCEELDSGYQGAPVRVRLKDRKGGDMSEWPEDLRVREFPA